MAIESRTNQRQDWGEHTQVATQILDDRGPEQTLRELGKKVSPTSRELFVVCDPSEALRQHFELGVTPFVLLHDLGTGAGQTFLQGLSERSGWRLQTLSIRRQGFGTLLASLSYLDCPLASGSLRMYLADVQAEPAEQQALRRQLIEAATVHVLIGAVLATPDVAGKVTAWRDELLAARHAGRVSLLALPQVRDPDWMMSLSGLTRTPRLQVEVAPASQVVTANWTLIGTYWNRQTQAALPGALQPIERANLSLPAEAPDVPAKPRTLIPMPVVGGTPPSATPMASMPPLSLEAHVTALSRQTGALRACIFVLLTREVWAQSAGANGNQMAEQGLALLAAAGAIGQNLALGRSVREVHVSLGEAQVLLRATRLRNGGVLMLILPRDADTARVREFVLQYEARALPVRAAP